MISKNQSKIPRTIDIHRRKYRWRIAFAIKKEIRKILGISKDQSQALIL